MKSSEDFQILYKMEQMLKKYKKQWLSQKNTYLMLTSKFC